MKRKHDALPSKDGKKVNSRKKSSKNGNISLEKSTIDADALQLRISSITSALFTVLGCYDAEKMNVFSRQYLADDAFLIIVQLEPTELYQVNQYKEIRGRESVSTYLLSSQRSVPDGVHFFKLVDFVAGSTDCFVTDPSSTIQRRRDTILINTTMSAKGTKAYEIVESFVDKLAETALESKMALLGAAET